MAEPYSRPVGVTVVAWLFIVGGVAGALAVLVWFARSGRITEGLPLEVIGGVAGAVFLGVVAGAKLLQGRSWAWYEATSLCVLTLGLGGFSVALEWGHPALGPGLAALGLVLLIYAPPRLGWSSTTEQLDQNSLWRRILNHTIRSPRATITCFMRNGDSPHTYKIRGQIFG